VTAWLCQKDARLAAALELAKILNAEDAEDAERTDHQLLRALCDLCVSQSPDLAAALELAKILGDARQPRISQVSQTNRCNLRIVLYASPVFWPCREHTTQGGKARRPAPDATGD